MAKRKQGNLPDPPDPQDFIHQPHDKYFKYVMKIREVALEFVQMRLDKTILERLDLGEMQIDETTYVDPKLKDSHSDVCYLVPFKDETKHQARIRLLFEHKSYSPTLPLTPQLLNYAASSIMQDVNQGKPINLPLTIVVYHGDQPWRKEMLLDYFSEMPEVLLPYVPSFDYEVIDVQSLGAEEILRLNGLYLPNILLALKFGRSEVGLINYFDKICIFAKGSERRELALMLFRATIVYFKNISPLKLGQMTTLISKLPAVEKRNFKTLREQEIELGLEQGIEKGIEKGIEQGIAKESRRTILSIKKNHPEWSAEVIAKLLDKSVTTVQSVLDSFEKEQQKREKTKLSKAELAAQKAKAEVLIAHIQSISTKHPEWTDIFIAELLETTEKTVKKHRTKS